MIFSVIDLLTNYLKMDVIGIWFDLLLYLFRIVPIFSMLFGYQKVQKLSLFSQICGPEGIIRDRLCEMEEANYHKHKETNILSGCCSSICGDMCYMDQNPFSYSKAGSGTEVTYMMVIGLLSFLLIVLYESKFKF